MTTKLKTLGEHNAEIISLGVRYSASMNPEPNGIECPICKTELLDSFPMVTLASNPPSKDIYCPKCDFRGYRLA